jgi:hypothetical protein
LEFKETAYSGRPQDICEMLRDITALAACRRNKCECKKDRPTGPKRPVYLANGT